MCKKMIEIDECVVPEGFEAIGFRVPEDGEWYLNPMSNRQTKCEGSDYKFHRLILKKKEEWVDAEEVFKCGKQYCLPLVRHFDTKVEYSLIAVTVKAEAIVEHRGKVKWVTSVPLSCLEYKKEC